MSYGQVVVGTDGSKTAVRAVASASRIAASLSASLTLVSAWKRDLDDPPPPSQESRYPGGTAAGAEARAAADASTEGAGIARGLGVTDVRQAQPIGSPADQLVEVADRHPDSLLVVGTVGLADRAERVVGNVPHQLTHHSPVDLLLVRRATEHDEAGWSTVGIATDGSSTAGRAVTRGLALARELGATPVLLTVARDQARGDKLLDKVAQGHPDAANAERRVLVSGDIPGALLDVSDDLDLLVIGNKGMSGPSRLLGSVSNRVTHRAASDLLLVNTTH